MKICIYGAGAIGGYLATGLADVEGIEVSAIARGAHLQAMRERGLTLLAKDTEKTIRLQATDNPAELGPQDAVIIGLKAHQAWETAEDVLPLLGAETSVVTCQNGVPWWYFHKLDGPYEGKTLESVDPGARQWREIGPERAIGCVVFPATEITEPGVIRHIYGDKFTLGEPDGQISERCQALSSALERGGFRAPILEDIRSEIWLKLWGNLCFNPISALTRATLDTVASHPDSYHTARKMMEEAEQVALALGAEFRVEIDRRMNGAAKVGAHRTSMLQDLESEKPMEIDALVSSVQELGQITGIPTPVIDVVLGLVRQLGRSQGLYPTFPEAATDAKQVA